MIATLTSESFSVEKLDDLEIELNTSLALIERDFPITLQIFYTSKLSFRSCKLLIITLHVGNNFSLDASYCGWHTTVRTGILHMDAFERFNSWMCQRVLNRANPEATVIETYLVFILYLHV